MVARRLLIPLVPWLALIVNACNQSLVDTPDTSTELRWAPIDSFARASGVAAIWGSGPDDVWVGYYGLVQPLRHFEGLSWESIDAGLPFHTYDIWGSGRNDVYVATSRGVRRYDGVGWSDVGISAQLVTGATAQEVYALDRDRIIRFDGADRDTLRVFANTDLSFTAAAIAFTGGRLVVARASFYGLDSLHCWDGTTWSSEDSPGRIRSLWGTSPDDLLAAGDDGGAGAIWQWDGVHWTTMPLPQAVGSIRDLVGVAPDQLYAATCCDGALLRYDGISWQAELVPNADDLIRVWASGAADIYVASGNDVVLHNDGAGWSTAIPGKPQYAEVVWAESPQRLVVAGRRSVYRFDHGTWTEEDLNGWGGSPTALVGRDWNDLYLADQSDGILHYDGTQWTRITDAGAEDLCVTPDGHLFAVSDKISRWNGVAWNHGRSVDDHIFSVWAAEHDYAIALGVVATWRYDGTVMRKIADGLFRDVWGLSKREVYFADRGGIVRYDGAAFHRFGPPDGYFLRLIGSGPDHIIAVGYPYLFIKNGDTWKSSLNPDQYRYVDLVAALDGSILRLVSDSYDRLSLSYHR